MPGSSFLLSKPGTKKICVSHTCKWTLGHNEVDQLKKGPVKHTWNVAKLQVHNCLSCCNLFSNIDSHVGKVFIASIVTVRISCLCPEETKSQRERYREFHFTRQSANYENHSNRWHRILIRYMHQRNFLIARLNDQVIWSPATSLWPFLPLPF